MAEYDDRQTKKLETASLTLGILSLIFYFILQKIYWEQYITGYYS